MRGLLKLALTTVGLGVLGFAFGDDGAISWGGNPKLLSGHPSVRMVSEKIVLNITRVTDKTDQSTDADCTFVFKNDGPACTVRIGFPDRANGAYEEDFMGADPKTKATHATLQNFKSWVNGVPIKTTVVLSQDPSAKGATYAGSWHAKVVKFKAGETLTIRDTYHQPESGGATASAGGLFLNEVQYVMSTGASWNGPIGSVVVEAHLKGVGAVQPIGELIGSVNPYLYTKWEQAPKNTVYYTGFARPSLGNDVIIFKANNLKPTASSDISLFWPEAPRN